MEIIGTYVKAEGNVTTPVFITGDDDNSKAELIDIMMEMQEGDMLCITRSK